MIKIYLYPVWEPWTEIKRGQKAKAVLWLATMVAGGWGLWHSTGDAERGFHLACVTILREANRKKKKNQEAKQQAAAR